MTALWVFSGLQQTVLAQPLWQADALSLLTFYRTRSITLPCQPFRHPFDIVMFSVCISPSGETGK